MDTSASIPRPASLRLLRCLWLAMTTGAGPALAAVSLAGWALLLAAGGHHAPPHHHGAPAHRAIPAAAAWLLMLVAMMPPLLTDPVGHLLGRIPGRRRWRAVALFAAGYAFVWMTAGWLLAAGAMRLITRAGPGWRAAAAAVLLAALWHATPARQACLRRCHAHPPLSVRGLAADRDAAKYGLATGAWCLGSCGVLMLVPLTFDAAHAAAMAAVMALMLAERHAPAKARRNVLATRPAPSGAARPLTALSE